MGRRVPVETLSLIHPLIYLSFLAAGFAATMAIITAMCSVRFRRKPPSSDPAPPEASPSAEAENENDKVSNNDSKENEEEEVEVKELPLPPALQPKDPLIAERMKRVRSERKAPMSLSMKMPRSLSVARNWERHKEANNNKGNIEGKLRPEDSVWMKTIILGEKCVPDEESDAVIYQGKGKRIAAYHTKRHSIASFLDTDALDQNTHTNP
ncbi:hypothetical protein Fmac_000562 [Flemingia macrophylla]|uniref:Transmembrane protein n=1 Tax=Flemingia macrophylla TaxID=520843 RepID=A0ABD1NFW0_9FABA